MIRADMETACEANIDALTVGWSETIEYTVKRGQKNVRQSKERTYGPLLGEMRSRVLDIMTSGSSGPSYNPNHSTSRPPSNHHYSDQIDTVQEQAERVLHWLRVKVTVINSAPRAQHRSPESVLYEIRVMVRSAFLNDADVATVLQTTSEWVSRARQTLGYDVRRVMLAHSVCHECKGALGVAEDASTDVECIGSPTKPGCGVTYSRMQWLDLMATEDTA